MRYATDFYTVERKLSSLADSIRGIFSPRTSASSLASPVIASSGRDFISSETACHDFLAALLDLPPYTRVFLFDSSRGFRRVLGFPSSNSFACPPKLVIEPGPRDDDEGGGVVFLSLSLSFADDNGSETSPTSPSPVRGDIGEFFPFVTSKNLPPSPPGKFCHPPPWHFLLPSPWQNLPPRHVSSAVLGVFWEETRRGLASTKARHWPRSQQPPPRAGVRREKRDCE